jgi:hypothetical protein
VGKGVRPASATARAQNTLTPHSLPPLTPAPPHPPSPVRERERLYEFVCENCPLSVGKTLSSRERDTKGLAHSTLVYGEIKFEPFAAAVLKIKRLYGGLQRRGGRFVDVGAGTGKPVFAAAVLHEWDSVMGIEILEGLHAASLDIAERWRTAEVQAALPEGLRALGIDLVCGDATTIDWADGMDVFFMNSTCFDEGLMQKLAVVADRMAVGSFGITFTKRLPSAKWKVLESEVYTMSWGSATVFIQQKVG